MHPLGNRLHSETPRPAGEAWIEEAEGQPPLPWQPILESRGLSPESSLNGKETGNPLP